MNSGFSNLTTLKAALLPDALRADTQFDAVIAAIGLGVAESFDRFCNRRFARLEDAEEIFDCNRTYCSLARYPVEEITKAETRDTVDGGWIEQTISNVVTQISEASGLVEFGATLGSNLSRVRLTYTGGYFWVTTEPTDEDHDEDVIPVTGFALPADLFDAWLEQCQYLFTERDAMGQQGIKKQGKEGTGAWKFAEIGLLKHVSDVLNKYTRFAA